MSNAASSPTPRNSDSLRKELLALLEGGQAHAKLEDAVRDFPEGRRGEVPQNLPYSAWQLLEHLRLAQRDILEFSDPPAGGYEPLQWPKDYWPEDPEPPSATSWARSIDSIHADRKAFVALLNEEDVDLYTPFSWGEGQNLLREALLIADHNAYHIGEMVMLRRLLGIWKK